MRFFRRLRLPLLSRESGREPDGSGRRDLWSVGWRLCLNEHGVLRRRDASGWLKGIFPTRFRAGFSYYPFPRIQRTSIGGYSLLMGWMPLVVASDAGNVPAAGANGAGVLVDMFAGTACKATDIAVFTRFAHALALVLCDADALWRYHWRCSSIAGSIRCAAIGVRLHLARGLAAFTEKVLQERSHPSPRSIT